MTYIRVPGKDILIKVNNVIDHETKGGRQLVPLKNRLTKDVAIKDIQAGLPGRLRFPIH